jgi:hypothetical protein
MTCFGANAGLAAARDAPRCIRVTNLAVHDERHGGHRVQVISFLYREAVYAGGACGVPDCGARAPNSFHHERSPWRRLILIRPLRAGETIMTEAVCLAA